MTEPRVWTLSVTEYGAFRPEGWDGPVIPENSSVRVVEAAPVVELLERLLENYEPTDAAIVDRYEAAEAEARVLLDALRVEI